MVTETHRKLIDNFYKLTVENEQLCMAIRLLLYTPELADISKIEKLLDVQTEKKL